MGRVGPGKHLVQETKAASGHCARSPAMVGCTAVVGDAVRDRGAVHDRRTESRHGEEGKDNGRAAHVGIGVEVDVLTAS